MEYLIGSKEEFSDFIDSIDGNVAILSHIDLDGISSAIFLEEMLKARGLEGKLKLRKFFDYKKGIFSGIYGELKKKKISYVFIADLNPENIDSEGFERLREEFNVFSIDHHPIGELKDEKGIIKTETGYCAGFICYELGKEIFNAEKWEWLVHAAIVSDMSYKSPEVLRFIQEDYPDVTEKNIHDSEPGRISSAISSALIYLDKDVEKLYEIIRKKEISKLEKYDEEIRKETDNWKRRYEEEAEFYPERNLYFYYFNPRFNIASFVSTLLSQEKNATFISVSDIKEEKGFVKISARNQNGEDMNKLLKKGVFGLENATGGGHIPAAGGRFMKKDLEKFKQNILN